MVEGIGGAFIHASDAKALARWYCDVLGIEFDSPPDADYYAHEFPVREADGERRLTRTVWAIFQLDPGESRSPDGFTINYRVNDLDAILERVRSLGVTVDKAENYDYGRFAWVRHPEGNRIELYQDLTICP